MFYISNTLEEKENKTKKQEASARANDAVKHVDWFILFILKLWLDQAWQAVMSNKLWQRLRSKLEKAALLVYLFYRQQCLKTTQKAVSNGY